MLKPQKGTPEWHQLKIALDDLKNPLKAQFLSNRTREDIINMLKNDFQCTDAEIAKLSGQKVGFNTEAVIPVTESQLKAVVKRLIKEESLKLVTEAPGDPYEVEYYVRVGGHSHIGQFPTFEQALRESVKLKKQFDKERATEEPGSKYAAGAGADGVEYIGVDSNDEFAVIYITQWYIDYSKSLPDEGFRDPESAKKWMSAAMKCLQTGKPAKGNYNNNGGK